MRTKTGIILSILLFSGSWAFAASNYSYTQNAVTPQYQSSSYQESYKINETTLKGHVVSVPSGTTVKAVTSMPLSSADLTVGQNVSMVLGSDFYYNNELIAASGSSVNGTVLEVSKAKHGSLNGKLLLRFTQIVTPYGVQIPISAIIKTSDNTGVLVGGTNVDVAKEYTKDLAVGSAAGALSGVVFGALAGGSVGQGAALGTAVGAGGGLVKSIWDKGNDVTIPVNSSVELILTQPITVNPTVNRINY